MDSPLKRACTGLLLCAGFATLALPGDASSADDLIEAKPKLALEISDAISHPNAGAAVGVIYLRIINHSNRSDRLIAVHSPAANGAELHETVVDGDFVRMKHRPRGFEIAAGGELVLESGGKHIMLTQLKRPLESGGSIDLELIFEHADKVVVKVPIQPRTP